MPLPPQRYAPKFEPLTKLTFVVLCRVCDEKDEVIVSRESLFAYFRDTTLIDNPVGTVTHLVRHGVIRELRDGRYRVRRPVRDVARLPGPMPHRIYGRVMC